MILKVGSDYLDFDGEIDIERQAKLFDSFSETRGDVSYRFEIPDTEKNIGILKLYSINQNDKIIYNNIPCNVQNDSGVSIFDGFLRVETSKPTDHRIQCSFFSGNSNWIKSITSNCQDVDYSFYDTDKTIGAITASWSNEHGLYFPLIDRGLFTDRLAETWYLGLGTIMPSNDFQGFIFVKDVVRLILQHHNIKIAGELLNDPVYNNLIVTDGKQDAGQQQIIDRTASVIGRVTTLTNGVYTKLTWDETTSPATQGKKHNFASSRYTADLAEQVNIVVKPRMTSLPPVQVYSVDLRVNGATISTATYGIAPSTINFFATLNAGDYIEIFYKPFTSTVTEGIGSRMTITPVAINRFFASQFVPTWKSNEFLKNVFNLFNTLIFYDQHTKTITVNLFKYLKSKTPINLSQHITKEGTYDDYTDFISSFSKQNSLTYSESQEATIQSYNDSQPVPYGQGRILVDNDYISPLPQDMIKSDFVASKDYIHKFADISLMKLDYVQQDQVFDMPITSVSNDGAGIAIFHCDNSSISVIIGLAAGSLMRIKSSSISDYNGTGVVSSVTTLGADTQIKFVNVPFQYTATGTIELLALSDKQSDPIIGIAVKDRAVTDVSSLSTIYIGVTAYSRIGYAYFFRCNQPNLSVNALNQGLSFGPIADPIYYQQSLKDNYFAEVDDILNDPVKKFAQAYIPEKIFNDITILEPVTAESEDYNSLFYVNRITGYKNSWTPCKMELIKLP